MRSPSARPVVSELQPIPAPTPPGLSPASHQWFVEAVQPHETALRRWLHVRFPRMDADDLVQESFLRILRAQASQPVEHPKAFLFTIARNLALNQIRHDRHEHREALREIDPSAVLDETPGIPEALVRRQEHELLIQALQQLPDRARQVFTLRRVYGLSIKEICARLGIAEKTAEAHISLAIRRCTDFVQCADQRAPRAPGSTVTPIDTRLL
jgi:RNA polymerase sigma factor (sigma-70 family)